MIGLTVRVLELQVARRARVRLTTIKQWSSRGVMVSRTRAQVVDLEARIILGHRLRSSKKVCLGTI
jgi:Fe-S cluster assembly scaffold protein SufB